MSASRPSQPLDPARFRLEPTLTGPEAAARAGFDLDTAKRIYRALGLPEVDDTEVEFDESDVEVLKTLKAVLDMGVPLDDVLIVARVYGQAFVRIADAETRLFRKRFVAPLVESGVSPKDIQERLAPVVDQLLDLTDPQIRRVHRRHLAVALQQLTVETSHLGTETEAVGFVDLVDFSRIADDLQGPDLTELIDQFESIVLASCPAFGVRMVKTIGDAVMFVSPDADRALECAHSIVEQVEGDENIPQARAGLDFGEVVPLGGDYFGHPVNVASRITAFARPGTIVVSEEFLESLSEPVDVAHLGTRRLKGVGRVRMFKVRVDETSVASSADEHDEE